MILIAGDSWGCGAWDQDPVTGHPVVYHRGLEQYLHNDGHKVINISYPGGSNESTVEQLERYLYGYTQSPPLWYNDPILQIFVFQTEWWRGKSDFRPGQGKQLVLRPEIVEWFELNEIYDDQKIISHYYNNLSHISQKYHIPIWIIGGCVDTIWLDQFEDEYSGLHIACQSFTNLLVNDNHRVENATCTWKMPVEYLVNAKQKNNAELIEYVLNMSDLADQRCDTFTLNKDWFPDNGHASHLGHKKLFDYLKTQGII